MSCTRPARRATCDVRLELGGHGAGQEGDLFAVLEAVLAVGGAVAQTAEELHQLRVHAGDGELQEGGLALGLDLLLELRLDLLDHLFDARRMDAAVGDQALQGDAGHLAAERIEAGEDDRFRRVVDDEVDAGRHLQGADVAPLAADDAPLHLVARQHHHRDRGLGDVVRGGALDGHADDALRLLVGLLAGLVLDPLDDVRGLDAGVVFEQADQLLARLLGGQAGDLLELGALLGEHAVEVGLLLFEPLLARCDGAVELAELLVALAQLVGPLVEGVFLLGEPPLERLRARSDACATPTRTRCAPGGASPWRRSRPRAGVSPPAAGRLRPAWRRHGVPARPSDCPPDGGRSTRSRRTSTAANAMAADRMMYSVFTGDPLLSRTSGGIGWISWREKHTPRAAVRAERLEPETRQVGVRSVSR